MKNLFIAIVFLSMSVYCVNANALSYTSLGFDYNADIQTYGFISGSLFPEGDLNLGGVPFSVPSGTDLNIWHSEIGSTSGSKSLSVDIGLSGVDKVYTIINTYWGESSPGSFAYIEFEGAGGAYYQYLLDGNFNIRDYFGGTYTNSLTSPDAANVWTESGVRLDMQTIDLPDAFLFEDQIAMTLVDNGATGFQRTFLYGLTVGTQNGGGGPSTVPEPATIILLGAGLLGLAGIRRKMTS
ncbi:hypothetical protein H4684_002638 [Desulfomicrobium macestii]|uniref:Ice-binding protein C-terminal domain-containing protein n=1 Tax=Desulfomicrobium macestii TaxID=90731 RepID=A0ABR9H5K4_9BACT|nr:PEP-CTERM sorting domain-containing protein [Desulfomicrobium macestii]MBE1425979.1 hypothetical protein [Desulfomicrobium macestii]